MKNISENYPNENETPTEFAEKIGLYYSTLVSQNQKKTKGQFFTPAPIAKFMGNLAKTDKEDVSILDPGCGTAILSCSIVESLISSNSKLKSISLDVYETDSEILVHTNEVLSYLKKWLNGKNITFHFNIYCEDFVLKNAKILNTEGNLFDVEVEKKYCFIISNPPYFKLNKSDIRAKATEKITIGQPNIYALFMAIASKMLLPKGQLIFITPRSYTSGNYFKSFREFFFRNVNIIHIHLFGSRKEAFDKDKILQETLILHASNDYSTNNENIIKITSSNGIKDLSNPLIKMYPVHQIMNFESNEKILHIPINEEDDKILKQFKCWNGSLSKYNIQISTGPVVAFRASKFIREVYENTTVFLAPLIWLHNVNKMNLHWPIEKPNKGQYIEICSESISLLLPNKNYILLRRFSSKDDKSRLIAAPYFTYDSKIDYVGIENKVNYIYRPKGILEKNEIYGLSALLNSTIFDKYFRLFNGNVNVSATELRAIPLPPLDLIKQIGDKIILENIHLSQLEIDDIVIKILNFE